MKYAIASYGAYQFAIKSKAVSGGNDKQEWLLAKSLAACNHEVILLVPQSTPLVADNIDGVRLVRCPTQRPTLLYVLWTLRKEKPDWFHVMGATPNLWICAVAAHLFGIKCAYAISHDRGHNPRTALMYRPYLWPLYAMGLRAVDRILAQHPQQADLMAPKYRQKTFVVNNVVEPLPTVKSEKPYISWVGWLRKVKRPEILLDIAKALPDVRLVVCGPVSEIESEKEFSHQIIDEFKKYPNIDYKGYVPRDETQRIIAQSAIFLSTAQAEGFPNTFLEAWVSSVPTVSLEIDPGGVMNSYHTGLVVSSVDETIKVIDELLSQPDKLRELGQNAYQYVERFHSGNTVCHQLEIAVGSKNV
jgi:glycosyltransferase involved in cell wall biosynthesis